MTVRAIVAKKTKDYLDDILVPDGSAPPDTPKEKTTSGGNVLNAPLVGKDTAMTLGNGQPFKGDAVLPDMFTTHKANQSRPTGIERILNASKPGTENFVSPNIQSSNLTEGKNKTVTEAPRKREPGNTIKSILGGGLSPVLSVYDELNQSGDKLNEGKIGEGTVGGIQSFLHSAFLPFTMPFGAASETMKDQGGVIADVGQGLDQTMQLPFDAVKQGSELVNKGLKAVGINTDEVGGETGKKINALSQELAGLYLMSKGHGIAKDAVDKTSGKPINDIPTLAEKIKKGEKLTPEETQLKKRFSNEITDINSKPKNTISDILNSKENKNGQEKIEADRQESPVSEKTGDKKPDTGTEKVEGAPKDNGNINQEKISPVQERFNRLVKKDSPQTLNVDPSQVDPKTGFTNFGDEFKDEPKTNPKQPEVPLGDVNLPKEDIVTPPENKPAVIPNVDVPYYMEVQGKKLPATSLKDASDKYQSAIKSADIGGDEAYNKGFANNKIYDKDGKEVGYISYNGKIWKGDPKNYKTNELLYNPYGEKPLGKEIISNKEIAPPVKESPDVSTPQEKQPYEMDNRVKKIKEKATPVIKDIFPDGIINTSNKEIVKNYNDLQDRIGQDNIPVNRNELGSLLYSEVRLAIQEGKEVPQKVIDSFLPVDQKGLNDLISKQKSNPDLQKQEVKSDLPSGETEKQPGETPVTVIPESLEKNRTELEKKYTPNGKLEDLSKTEIEKLVKQQSEVSDSQSQEKEAFDDAFKSYSPEQLKNMSVDDIYNAISSADEKIAQKIKDEAIKRTTKEVPKNDKAEQLKKEIADLKERQKMFKPDEGLGIDNSKDYADLIKSKEAELNNLSAPKVKKTKSTPEVKTEVKEQAKTDEIIEATTEAIKDNYSEKDPVKRFNNAKDYLLSEVGKIKQKILDESNYSPEMKKQILAGDKDLTASLMRGSSNSGITGDFKIDIPDDGTVELHSPNMSYILSLERDIKTDLKFEKKTNASKYASDYEKANRATTPTHNPADKYNSIKDYEDDVAQNKSNLEEAKKSGNKKLIEVFEKEKEKLNKIQTYDIQRNEDLKNAKEVPYIKEQLRNATKINRNSDRMTYSEHHAISDYNLLKKFNQLENPKPNMDLLNIADDIQTRGETVQDYLDRHNKDLQGDQRDIAKYYRQDGKVRSLSKGDSERFVRLKDSIEGTEKDVRTVKDGKKELDGYLNPKENNPELGKNKAFPDEIASKRANDLLQRHSKSLVDDKGNFKTPFSKQDIEDLGYIGGWLVEKGVRNFADWSEKMIKGGIEDFKGLGQGIKEHLQDIYDRLKKDKPELFKEEKKEPKVEKPAEKPEEKNSPKESGIAQRLREARTDIESSEIGLGYSAEEERQIGKDFIKQGVDPNEVISDFKKDKKISADTMAIVNAHADDLAHETNLAEDNYLKKKTPENKEIYETAKKKEKTFLDDVKPMQTMWSNIGKAQQGGVNIDTGTFSGLRRAFEKENGKGFTPEQEKKAIELTDRVKQTESRLEDLNKKFVDMKDRYDKMVKDKPEKNYSASSKALAQKIRTAKIHKPGIFSAATPGSLAWDLGVETVAKSIEIGGDVAQAIHEGIKKLKETDWYKNLDENRKKEAEKQFEDWHNNVLAKKIEDFNFGNKKGNNFTPNEAKAVWNHAKENYIDKGNYDFQDMVAGLSKETGLSAEQVRNALASPKQLREITDEIYKVRYARNRMQQTAKAWVRSANTPKALRFIKSVPNFFFGLKVFGHGTVGMITHAGADIFRPSAWKTYFPNFIKQFDYAYGKQANYEKAMTDLQADPDYIFWKRAGLAVDPTRIYDDYQEVGKLFGRLGEIGNRGFQILKVHRLETAKNIYEHLSEIEKSDPNTAKEIANIVNHSTGTSNVFTPKMLNVAFFAPRLEASRWARLIVEPTKALKTFANWKDAKPSERVAAKLITRRAGEQLATLAGLLAANQAILSLSGSKQNINFSDPTKSDWLRFKAGNKVIDVSGGMLSTMTFIARLGEATFASQKSLRGKSRADVWWKTAGDYGRGKLSPFMGNVVDFATHTDYSGNVLPPFNDKPAKGREKYGWLDYILKQQTPIPAAEGIKDVYDSMKEKGMSEPDIKQILNGALMFVASGGTGARVREEYAPKSSSLKSLGTKSLGTKSLKTKSSPFN